MAVLEAVCVSLWVQQHDRLTRNINAEHGPFILRINRTSSWRQESLKRKTTEDIKLSHYCRNLDCFAASAAPVWAVHDRTACSRITSLPAFRHVAALPCVMCFSTGAVIFPCIARSLSRRRLLIFSRRPPRIEYPRSPACVR